MHNLENVVKLYSVFEDIATDFKTVYGVDLDFNIIGNEIRVLSDNIDGIPLLSVKNLDIWDFTTNSLNIDEYLELYEAIGDYFTNLA